MEIANRTYKNKTLLTLDIQSSSSRDILPCTAVRHTLVLSTVHSVHIRNGQRFVVFFKIDPGITTCTYNGYIFGPPYCRCWFSSRVTRESHVSSFSCCLIPWMGCNLRFPYKTKKTWIITITNDVFVHLALLKWVSFRMTSSVAVQNSLSVQCNC